jgi:hypothetical protein
MLQWQNYINLDNSLVNINQMTAIDPDYRQTAR